MDDLIEVLDLLRNTHRFGGYVHVKILAGAEAAQVERITALATRISINLETPCGNTLEEIAPEKSYDTTFATLSRARALVVHEQQLEADGWTRNALRPGGASGMTTQFVVGATPDSDRTIVNRVSEIYAGGGVHHVHFSAFRPIRDTPLETRAAAPALREHRLYQTDYLVALLRLRRGRHRLCRATATCRSSGIQRSPGRLPTRSAFPWTSRRRRTERSCAFRASGF